MNTQLVDSLVRALLALPMPERALLEAKLFANLSYPTASELNQLSESGFEFLLAELDLYRW
jgi:hypothetical protein